MCVRACAALSVRGAAPHSSCRYEEIKKKTRPAWWENAVPNVLYYPKHIVNSWSRCLAGHPPLLCLATCVCKRPQSRWCCMRRGERNAAIARAGCCVLYSIAGEKRRLRVGYVSSDFVNHPTADLIQTALLLHDRERWIHPSLRAPSHATDSTTTQAHAPPCTRTHARPTEHPRLHIRHLVPTVAL